MLRSLKFRGARNCQTSKHPTNQPTSRPMSQPNSHTVGVSRLAYKQASRQAGEQTQCCSLSHKTALPPPPSLNIPLWFVLGDVDRCDERRRYHISIHELRRAAGLSECPEPPSTSRTILSAR